MMSKYKFGCVGIVNATGKLTGMITDGDLRRHFGTTRSVNEIMTHNPTTITAEMLAAEVIELINTRSITAVFVVDDMHQPIGLIHIHDLLREGVS
jgi:arabinose-5-phosphate isomerase